MSKNVYKLQSMMLRKGFILAAILFHTLFVCAQNGALQTFTLDRPYPVERLQPPKGKTSS